MSKENHIHFHFETLSSASNYESFAKPKPKPKPPPPPTIQYVGVNAYGRAYSSLETIRYTKDGTNWSNINSGGFAFNYSGGAAVARGSSIWVAVGNYDTGLSSIQYSINGSNWSNSASQQIDSPYAITYGLNTWLVGTSDNYYISSILYSRDAINWSNTDIYTERTYGISVGSNVNRSTIIVAACRSENYSPGTSSIQYSMNGSNWYSANSGGFTSINDTRPRARDVAYGSNMWVAVGDSDSPQSTIQWSRDGSNWSNANTGGFTGNYENYSGRKIVYGNRLWLAFGQADSLVSMLQCSTDGSNWCNAGAGLVGNYIDSITYGSNKWIAYGSPMQYSTNGSNWTHNTNDVYSVVKK